MTPEDAAKIISLDQPPLGASELDAIVTIAYLAMTADGFTNQTELGAFTAMVARLRALATRTVTQSEYRTTTGIAQPRELEQEEVDELVNRARSIIDDRHPGEVMTELASNLSRTARLLAYRVAYTIVIVDLADTRAEHGMLADLADALEISRADDAQIVDEVLAALSGVKP